MAHNFSIMAVLNIPDKNIQERDVTAIRSFLNARGIWFDQWEAKEKLEQTADQETVLNAYSHLLRPFI